ncbi:hypothetical protein ILYODFUR_006526, partial [Ilyodon furcidens]
MVSLKELRRSTAQGHRGRRVVTPRTGHQSFPGPTQRLPRQQLTPSVKQTRGIRHNSATRQLAELCMSQRCVTLQRATTVICRPNLAIFKLLRSFQALDLEMNEEELVEYFRAQMRKDPDMASAVAAIRTLLEFLKRDKGETILGLRESLTGATDCLKGEDSSVAVSSGGELFLRFISLTSLEHQ